MDSPYLYYPTRAAGKPADARGERCGFRVAGHKPSRWRFFSPGFFLRLCLSVSGYLNEENDHSFLEKKPEKRPWFRRKTRRSTLEKCLKNWAESSCPSFPLAHFVA
ncbi:hypothetical protein [uncultured Allobaculum sp.]|uniref:hypothetical protein n=1 Tax=uncultured Allobaculum sp. TaxID=1187017 RepID=UPI00261A6DCB|nr:hypothetical protein [uncultured Allobaculum sp.]